MTHAKTYDGFPRELEEPIARLLDSLTLRTLRSIEAEGAGAKLDIIIRKLNLLLKAQTGGDLSPEAKAAFQEEVTRLEQLANPPTE